MRRGWPSREIRFIFWNWADTAVAYAREHFVQTYGFTAETADARQLPREDATADVVLLMGPLYHLQKREDRDMALGEACRVLKPGGLLVAAGISKYSTATWALSTYSDGNDYLDDDVFLNMLKEEISTGNHNRPESYCRLIAEAYFTTAQDMAAEIEAARVFGGRKACCGGLYLVYAEPGGELGAAGLPVRDFWSWCI